MEDVTASPMQAAGIHRFVQNSKGVLHNRRVRNNSSKTTTKKSQVRGGGEVAETLSDGKQVWKENRKIWGQW